MRSWQQTDEAAQRYQAAFSKEQKETVRKMPEKVRRILDALPDKLDQTAAGALPVTSKAFCIALSVEKRGSALELDDVERPSDIASSDAAAPSTGKEGVMYVQRSFLLRLSVWLPNDNEFLGTDTVTKATRFLAGLACTFALKRAGEPAAYKHPKSTDKETLARMEWSRSVVHTLTSTEKLDEQDKLHTEMGFRFTTRLLKQDVEMMETDSAKKKSMALSDLFSAPNAAEDVLTLVLQDVLTILGEMGYHFAGRKSLDIPYVNVARNEVRLRHEPPVDLPDSDEEDGKGGEGGKDKKKDRRAKEEELQRQVEERSAVLRRAARRLKKAKKLK